MPRAARPADGGGLGAGSGAGEHGAGGGRRGGPFPDGHELLISALSDGNATESAGIAVVQSAAQAAAGSLTGG
ncbi:hypothetical protein [Kitasatospora mediocidica]|uniref:hypothetical protein n=1 Tax=Kitasatospora mediocidica TaxID=58352 RepID=UPI000562429F|nr:hypothetical protein [Kitasatospora mediocidica]